MDFCETHGLDLPCKMCIADRQEERQYLKGIEDALNDEKSDNRLPRLEIQSL